MEGALANILLKDLSKARAVVVFRCGMALGFNWRQLLHLQGPENSWEVKGHRWPRAVAAQKREQACACPGSDFERLVLRTLLPQALHGLCMLSTSCKSATNRSARLQKGCFSPGVCKLEDSVSVALRSTSH